MTQEEINKGSLIIAKYMDISNSNITELDDKTMFLISRNCPIMGWFILNALKYQSSFDWQNPVWVKAIKETGNIMMIMQEDKSVSLDIVGNKNRQFVDFAIAYHAAIDIGSTEEGFRILVSVIQWINQNKK